MQAKGDCYYVMSINEYTCITEFVLFPTQGVRRGAIALPPPPKYVLPRAHWSPWLFHALFDCIQVSVAIVNWH